MITCPLCGSQNEDGVLFCEKCKTDLAGVPPGQPAAAPPGLIAVAVAEPLPEASPSVVAQAGLEGIPVAQIEAAPPAASAPPAVAVAVPIAESTPVTLATQPPTVPISALAAAAGAPSVEDSEIAETMAPFRAPTLSPGGPTPVAPPTPAPSPEGTPLSPGAQPRLIVLRGLKINSEYPLYEGHNFIGRADEKPVDIDLEEQEQPDRIWSSRQHALITFEDNRLYIEDLNSSNGTFVNRTKVYPGQRRPLQVNDVIQIGTVQMKVKA
jgi:hypothetical protein